MRLLSLALCATLAFGCAQLPTVTTVEAPEALQPEVDIARSLIGSLNSINRDDLQTAFADWHPDVEVIVMGPGMERRATNRREAIEDMRLRRDALNLRLGAERVLVTTDDIWVLQGVAQGRHRETFQGVAPTGEAFGVPFLQIGETRDGRTTRVLHFDAEYASLVQLGVLPGDYPRQTFPLTSEIVAGRANARNEQTLARVTDAIARGDWTTVRQHVASDVELHQHDLGMSFTGYAGVQQALERNPITDVTLGTQQMLSSGDFVVAWGPMSGRFTGRLANVDGRGERVDLHMAQVVRFDGDRIAEVSVYADLIQVLRQLDAAAAADLR